MAARSGDGSTNIYTLKDKEEYNLIDNSASSTAQFLNFAIKRCDNATTISSMECADFGKNDELLIEYLAQHTFAVLTSNNYVDYNEVDPFEGPIKHASNFVDNIELQQHLDQGRTKLRRFSFIEHQITLQDSLVQIMDSPEEFSLLNVDITSKTEWNLKQSIENAFFMCVFDLSQKVQVETRKVVSLP